jgi:SAM-dependent methyltransferase
MAIRAPPSKMDRMRAERWTFGLQIPKVLERAPMKSTDPMEVSGEATEGFLELDDQFDSFYPDAIRRLSSLHWTPVIVARRAAQYLVSGPGTRVLDVGCGPGKFCMVGAMTTEGVFTGVEQRDSLAKLARATLKTRQLRQVRILHANITEVHFGQYEAFYLFNPFEENLFQGAGIDESVEYSSVLYEQYTEYVGRQLERTPLGTRVVTYHGSCEEMPEGFECQRTSFGGSLKFWVHTGDPMARKKSLEARFVPGDWRNRLEFLAQDYQLAPKLAGE